MTEAATDYRPMWESLGLDLSAHDMLLAAIPMLYRDAYLSQTNRPEGMAYGRHAAAANFGGRTVTEISAYGRGAAFLFPEARSVLDVGGQDTKASSWSRTVGSVTLLHRGEDRARIARGLCESVAGRTLSMLKRIGAPEPLIFAGGGARNTALSHFVRAGFGGTVLVPAEPQTVGAVGAALLGAG